MKKSPSKYEAKKNNNLYNIFNDLMEYELDCKLNLNKNSDSDDASTDYTTDTDDREEDYYFYKATDHIEETPESDHISISPPLTIEENPKENIKDLHSLLGSKSLSYPPGFETFFPPLTCSSEENHSSFNSFEENKVAGETTTSKDTATSKDGDRSGDKKVFFKKKYPYNHNNFRPWPPLNYDNVKTELDSKSQQLNSVKSEVDLINKRFVSEYDSKRIIPTKKFYFGEMYKGMKCIKSFGIILFAKDKNIWRINNDTDIKYLLYQRRDTYAFMDFMRGLWNSETKMINLLASISKDERKRLLNYNFDELWDDLWVSHSTDPSGIYIARKEYAKKKFTAVYDQMLTILNGSSTNGEDTVCDAPWGFPKGKKNSKESDIECAKREFLEETQLDLKDINILYDVGTIIENYIADNGKYYTTFYYIAEVPKILPIKYIATPGCIRKTAVSDEVANLIWSNYLDSKLLLDSQKLAILDEAHKRIVNK